MKTLEHKNFRQERYQKRFDRKPQQNFSEGGGALTVRVYQKPDASKEERDQLLDKAISKFKKILEKEGIMQEIKDREYFLSPGRKRYIEKKQLVYRQKVKQKKYKKFGYQSARKWQ